MAPGIADSLQADQEKLSAAAAPGRSWIRRRGAIGWYQRQSWRFQLRSPERGYFLVGPGHIRSADILGLFPAVHDDEACSPLVVFPRVFPLEDLGLSADHPFGDRKGRNQVFEDPLRIAGLREYREGALPRIDGRRPPEQASSVARLRTLRDAPLCNAQYRHHDPRLGGLLKTSALSATASIAVWGAGARFAVGLLANGSFPDADRPIRLPPSRARDQLTRVLEALAVIQPLTMGDLAGAIQRESGRMPAGSTVVVVASLIPDALAGAIARLHDEGHHVYVVATSERALHSVPPGIPVQALGRAFERRGVFA
jgi:uncharacterized protein (DUF58 family)